MRNRVRDDTLVLETEFELAGGDRVALIDFMPVIERGGRVDLVRIVEGRRGRVRMKMEAVFRFDYGRIVPWVRRRDYGLSAIAGPDALQLRTPGPAEHAASKDPFGGAGAGSKHKHACNPGDS